MPNFNAAFKEEIARVARKQLRSEVDPLRKLLAQQRTTLSALKKQIATLERALHGTSKRRSEPEPQLAEAVQRRFSAQRLAAHRAKLGLSAAAYARLVGVSSLSVYKWEAGKVRPRASQIEALAAVRNLTRAEIEQRLNQS